MEASRADLMAADASDNFQAYVRGRLRWIETSDDPAAKQDHHDDHAASLFVTKRLFDFGRTQAKQAAAIAEEAQQGAYTSALRLYNEGDVEGALVQFDEAVEQNPQDVALRETHARVLYKAKRFEANDKYKDFTTMMVKTHLSLSHDPTIKGVPRNWTLPIRDFLIYGGARFICPVAGNISLMPGTGSNPAYRRIDVNPDTGKVEGLF